MFFLSTVWPLNLCVCPVVKPAEPDTDPQKPGEFRLLDPGKPSFNQIERLAVC